MVELELLELVGAMTLLTIKTDSSTLLVVIFMGIGITMFALPTTFMLRVFLLLLSVSMFIAGIVFSRTHPYTRRNNLIHREFIKAMMVSTKSILGLVLFPKRNI